MSVKVFNTYILRHLTLHTSTFLKKLLEYILHKSPFGIHSSQYIVYLTKLLVTQATENRKLEWYANNGLKGVKKIFRGILPEYFLGGTG